MIRENGGGIVRGWIEGTAGEGLEIKEGPGDIYHDYREATFECSFTNFTCKGEIFRDSPYLNISEKVPYGRK
jgi:hypothetical protein